jgi:pimeloyl-ACP methyl ester carboxylesterase
MNKVLFFFTIFLLSINLYPQQINGSWKGSLDIKGASLRIVFNIKKTGSIYESTMDSPDQGAYDISTTSTEYSEGKLEIIAKGLGLHYRGDLKNDSIIGTFKQGAMSMPLNLTRSAEPIITRPQTPLEPLQYVSELVKLTSKDGNHTISGTLTRPHGDGVFPAIVLIAGSGPNDRDETFFGHKPFLVISDHLTKNGYAVFRYDKRGVKSSTGNFAQSTINDFARDAAMAVEYLKERKDIDSNKIGLLGHSEGGLVASMVAADNNDIGFVVLMASPGIKGIEIILDQNELSMTNLRLEPDVIEEVQEVNKEMFTRLIKWNCNKIDSTELQQKLLDLWEILPSPIRSSVDKDSYLRSQYNAMITPGYRSFLSSNPALILQNVKCPVLAINGKLDSQVAAAKNLNSINEALRKGGNKNSETKIYANLNHLFQESITGLVTEYAKIEQTISPEVLSDITNWLNKQVK